jgi:hypothetical protein
MEMSTDTKKYADILQVLQHEFCSQFKDFRRHEATFSFFLSSSDLNIRSVPDEFQREL